MIGSLLGDPESLKQLGELAELLKSETQSGAAPDSPSPSPAADTSPAADASPADGETAQGSSDSLRLDPVSLMKLMNAVTSAGGDDKNRTLLLALKPYLGKERRDKVDKAVKLLKIYAVITEQIGRAHV